MSVVDLVLAILLHMFQILGVETLTISYPPIQRFAHLQTTISVESTKIVRESYMYG